MLEVIVTFDPSANRASAVVKLNRPDSARLDPQNAIAARNVAAGLRANAWVTDGIRTYRVVGKRARHRHRARRRAESATRHAGTEGIEG
jgi:hypothetical protein